MSHADLAHAVFDAIFHARGYIAARYPEKFDAEMEDELLRIAENFSRYIGRSDRRCAFGPDESHIFERSLGTNYLIAQSATLLVYVSDIQRISQGNESVAVMTAELFRQLRALYMRFIGDGDEDAI